MEYMTVEDYHYKERITYAAMSELLGISRGYMSTLKNAGAIIGVCAETGLLIAYRPIQQGGIKKSSFNDVRAKDER